jgi:hypothetical protein
MVYKTELLGFWTFSIVWYSREHDVSELDLFPSSGEGGGQDTYSVGPLTGDITTCLHNFSHFFAWVFMHLVLLVMFVAQISASFSIPVPRMCVLHHNFLLSPAELAGSQMIY